MGETKTARELFGVAIGSAASGLPKIDDFNSLVTRNSAFVSKFGGGGTEAFSPSAYQNFLRSYGFTTFDMAELQTNASLAAKLNNAGDDDAVKKVLDEVAEINLGRIGYLKEMSTNELVQKFSNYFSPDGTFTDKEGLFSVLKAIKTPEQIIEFQFVYKELEKLLVGNKLSPLVKVRYDTLNTTLTDILNGKMDIDIPENQKLVFDQMDNLVTTDDFLNIYAERLGVSPDSLIPWTKTTFGGKRSIFKKMSNLSTGIEGLDKAIKKIAMMGIFTAMMFIFLKFIMLDVIKDAVVELLRDILELGQDLVVTITDVGSDTIWELLKPFMLPIGIFCAVILMVVIFFISKGGNPRNLAG